jgi:oligopeptide transport system permease protein
MPVPTAMPAVAPLEEVEQGASLWRDALRRFSRNRMAIFGLGFLLLLAIAALAAPLFVQSYSVQNLAYGAKPPSSAHWLGTDVLGRDLLSRVVHGSRISLAVGICATLVSLTIGVFYGSISGYVGGRTDAVMMRLVDLLYALPFTVFVILLMVIFGRNIILLFMAIGAVEWLTVARIVRGQVLSLRRQEFIEAAIALGLRKRTIILRHLVPNVLGITIIYATLTVPSVMLLEAALSFLGFGVQPPMSSLGVLIDEGARNIEEFPWLLIFPGVVFSLTLFSLNFLGDGLRDALDPKAAKD